MERNIKYVKFFRFRSPVDRRLRHQDRGAFWLFDSAKYIDVTKEELMQECIAIGIKTYGALKVDYLLKLPFDDYEFIRQEVEKIKIG
jgi:hypothetical protein